MQHIDFMIGTQGTDVDGIQEDGTVVPVFRNGNWVIWMKTSIIHTWSNLNLRVPVWLLPGHY